MRRTLSFLFLLFFFYSNAQDEIFLENPSFEDYPKLSHTPTGWYNCNFEGESQVDTHPVPESEFQVNKTAYDGNTYLGMIVRDNETWEAVGQRLSQPLKAGKVYSFSMHLARSATYLNKLESEKDNLAKSKKVNFATPIKLRIWGGNDYCKKEALLAESTLIINTRWLNFNFQFEPKTDANYITFEAYYQTPNIAPYNGNILLDNASTIAEVVDGFVTGRNPKRAGTINKSISKDTLVSKPVIDKSTTQKTNNSYIKNKFPKNKAPLKKEVSIVNKKEKERILPKTEIDNQGKNKFSSSSIINFYKEHISLVEFQDNTAELDKIAKQALSLMAERLLTVDKDLKIIIQAKAPDASLKKERRNAIKSILSKAKLKANQYTFGFETNTPVLINESNSSVRIKLCLR